MGTVDERWDETKERVLVASRKAGVDPGIVAKIVGHESDYQSHIRLPDGRHGYGMISDDDWVMLIHHHGDKYGVPNAPNMSREEALSDRIRNNPDLQMGMLAESVRFNVMLAANKDSGFAPNPDWNSFTLHKFGNREGIQFLEAMAQNPDQRVDKIFDKSFIDKHADLLIGPNFRPVTLDTAYKALGEQSMEYRHFASEAREAAKNAPVRLDPMADGKLKQGEKGEAVETLQKALSQLGYKKNGDLLPINGVFDEDVKNAVKVFQGANGMKETGDVDKGTFAAIKRGAQLANLEPMYHQALDQLRELHKELGPKAGLGDPEDRQRAAASIALQARSAGMTRIDDIVISNGGKGMHAVETNPGNSHDQRRAYMDLAGAKAEPVVKSLEGLFAEDMRQRQQQDRSGQEQEQQRTQQAAPTR